jgi:uncharacterized membrane protein YdfJ with MMPL/SSD domain
MRTRVIQDDPDSGNGGDPKTREDTLPIPSRGIASRAAHWSAAHRKTAIWGWLAFAIGAFMIGNMIGGAKTLTDIDQFTGEARDAEQALDDAGLRPITEVVFLQSEQLTIDDPEFQAAVNDVTDRLAEIKYVENLQSPLDSDGDVTDDGHTALINFEVAGESTEVGERVDPALTAVAAVQDDYPDFTIEEFGGASAEEAIDEVIQGDLGKAGMLSLPVTLIILTLTFGTLVAASVPLLIGLTSVLAAMGLITFFSLLSPVDGNVNAVILLIGLAVGVDYSLFYLRREREERAAGRSESGALAAAAATSGRAVLISGLTVIVAMAGMFISGDKAFISYAAGTILVVAIAMFASLTVLPAMLAWLGDRVEKGRIPFVGRNRRPAGQSRFWTAVTERVMRRPGLSILLAGGFLIALSIPALQMKSVTSGIDELPQDLAVIQTYEKVKAEFPIEGVTATVVVEAEDTQSGAAADGIAAMTEDVEASDSFLPGVEVAYSEDGTVAQIDVPTPGNGTDAPSNDALDELRGEIIPATVGGVEGVTVNVSGDAAGSADFADKLNQRLPLIFAFVFILAFLLLLVTFRSIVIPIKAIVLNLLSVGAAFGVLVLVFQNGNGESFLGFTSNGGVANWLPLFLFVVLFGLSMDYHVFILSRIKELYDRGMSNDRAVQQGISTTAGTVTSAALVMVGVFLVFVSLAFLDFKEMGLGLAAAVLIDATVIRGVLLPASMKLLGDWNWYLPSWLEWLPRIGGEDHPPEPPGTGRPSEDRETTERKPAPIPA